jgi:hypothetical protein
MSKEHLAVFETYAGQKKANALYITDLEKRVNMGDTADMFYVPEFNHCSGFPRMSG